MDLQLLLVAYVFIYICKNPRVEKLEGLPPCPAGISPLEDPDSRAPSVQVHTKNRQTKNL